jgi:hypothetical protein
MAEALDSPPWWLAVDEIVWLGCEGRNQLKVDRNKYTSTSEGEYSVCSVSRSCGSGANYCSVYTSVNNCSCQSFFLPFMGRGSDMGQLLLIVLVL